MKQPFIWVTAIFVPYILELKEILIFKIEDSQGSNSRGLKKVLFSKLQPSHWQ